MVKWNEGWLLKKDDHEHIVKDLGGKLDYDSFQSILGISTFDVVSDKDDQAHAQKTPKPTAPIIKPPLLLDALKSTKIFLLEAAWLYKIAE